MLVEFTQRLTKTLVFSILIKSNAIIDKLDLAMSKNLRIFAKEIKKIDIMVKLTSKKQVLEIAEQLGAVYEAVDLQKVPQMLIFAYSCSAYGHTNAIIWVDESKFVNGEWYDYYKYSY